MNNKEKLYLSKFAKGRCWDGYEPVPGKAAYSEDSCRPTGSKKKKEKRKEQKDKKKRNKSSSSSSSSSSDNEKK